MEKKTIGKFISALRRANGMTQKELGEKLFVSDKTVSRWECDECTPELSLIPAIAELFSITTDELLRGERNNPDKETAYTEDIAAKQKAKSDKQFKVMLHNRLKKYKNLSLISVGISILGLIAAMICNLGFAEGLIAFCLASAFIVASEICQICFAVNARLLIDEDDDTYTDRIKEANTKIMQTAITISVVNVALFAFCLPLVMLIDGANYGLTFDSWLAFGFVFAVIALSLSYVVYVLWIQPLLIRKDILFFNETKREKISKSNKLLGKIFIIASCIALVLGFGIYVVYSMGTDGFAKKEVFYTCEEFKEYVETQYDEWYADGNITFTDPETGESWTEVTPHNKKFGQIKDNAGNVICEYYYNPDLYRDIIFTPTSNDKMPVTVYTNQAFYEASNLFNELQELLLVAIVLDFVVCAGVYIIKLLKLNKGTK